MFFDFYKHERCVIYYDLDDEQHVVLEEEDDKEENNEKKDDKKNSHWKYKKTEDK